jgi:hypothetical protein
MSDFSTASTPNVDAASRGEAVQAPAALVVDWLRVDPELTFKSARRDAERLNFRLTPRAFAEARRELGMTAAPPRPAARTSKDAEPEAGNKTMEKQKSGGSPLMAFAVEFVRNRPDAEYAEVKAAAAAEGFSLPPIVFGRARKALGLTGGGRGASSARASTSTGAKKGRAPRASKASPESFGDLGRVLGRLQEMADDRDRFHDALREIQKILRDVL